MVDRTATVLIRPQPNYRRDAIWAGLERRGFKCTANVLRQPKPEDVLVIWNRYGGNQLVAGQYEAAGATVIVVENGWIGQDDRGLPHYAMCLKHHNGAGEWHVGDDDRWTRLNTTLSPWRSDGRHILVLPQRGIGPLGVGMPSNWVEDALGRLRAATKRLVRVRQHPGKTRPPLDPDFSGCWAAVTWGSGAAIKAIAAGIPVFYDMPNWIGGPAAVRGLDNIEQPFLGDRLPMLRRLAWAQWSVAEIRAGEPFKWLLA